MALDVHAEAPPLHEDTAGVLRVGSTRVSLDSVVAAFHRRGTPEQIVEEYPSLELADVYDVIAYYLRHRTDVDRYLREQQQAASDMMDRLRSEFPQPNLRQKLTKRIER